MCSIYDLWWDSVVAKTVLKGARLWKIVHPFKKEMFLWFIDQWDSPHITQEWERFFIKTTETVFNDDEWSWKEMIKKVQIQVVEIMQWDFARIHQDSYNTISKSKNFFEKKDGKYFFHEMECDVIEPEDWYILSIHWFSWWFPIKKDTNNELFPHIIEIENIDDVNSENEFQHPFRFNDINVDKDIKIYSSVDEYAKYIWIDNIGRLAKSREDPFALKQFTFNGENVIVDSILDWWIYVQTRDYLDTKGYGILMVDPKNTHQLQWFTLNEEPVIVDNITGLKYAHTKNNWILVIDPKNPVNLQNFLSRGTNNSIKVLWVLNWKLEIDLNNCPEMRIIKSKASDECRSFFLHLVWKHLKEGLILINDEDDDDFIIKKNYFSFEGNEVNIEPFPYTNEDVFSYVEYFYSEEEKYNYRNRHKERKIIWNGRVEKWFIWSKLVYHNMVKDL